MKLLSKAIACIVLLNTCYSIFSIKTQWPNKITYKAILNNNQGSFYITCPEQWLIFGTNNKTVKKIIMKSNCISIQGSKKGLYINETQTLCKDFFLSTQSQKPLIINNTLCYGLTRIQCDERKITITTMSPLSYKNNTVEQFNDLFITFVKRAQEIKKSSECYLDNTYLVKVLLDEISDETHTCLLHSKRGFIVSTPAMNNNSKQLGNELLITIKKNDMYINGKKCREKTLHIKSKDNTIYFNNKSYHGFFILTATNNTVKIINCINLEDYVCAVLNSETWPGWPLEVNKAFAIASRSYVVAMMLRAQNNNLPYHIKDTNEHQRYNLYGTSATTDDIKQAVYETKGLFLSFENEPVLAMFDSCCGGIIPAYIDGFDFTKAPYLARKYACHFCKTSSLYSWQKMYTHQEFEHLVFKELTKALKKFDISIHKKDKAGIVQEIHIKEKGSVTKISGKKFYSLSKDIKSFAYTIQKKAGKIILKGQGFGHHLGLCQWGARQMVREGWDFISILQFYYPGTIIMKLTRSKQ